MASLILPLCHRLLAFGVAASLWFSGTRVAAAETAAPPPRDYHFDRTISRPVLENYLSRSITMEGLLNGRGDLPDNIRMLKSIGAKYIGRALCLWNAENDFSNHVALARQAVPLVLAADPDIILEACVFETVSPRINKIAIPDWVFTAFGLPVEQRNFRYDDMIYPEGQRRPMGPNAQVPDESRPETQLWFYYQAATYIDLGCEGIHFGQVEIMNQNDPDNLHWARLLGMVREYAARHARHHMVLCDGHTPTGGLMHRGNPLLDFNAFPLRIKEVPGQPEEAILKLGFSDGLYNRSKGGRTFSGWTCDHLPYFVELDNYGVSRHPGQANEAGEFDWVWGYDEITWFAHQTQPYRAHWLQYAWDWVRKTDPNGYLEMPGSRTASSPDIHWYFANNPSPAVPTGLGDEAGIHAVWAADTASSADRPQTFCNPLDLPYRFQLQAPSRREAADPTLVRFHDEYWLFVSKSGGYWHSPDLNHWKFVKPTGLPLEDYAPTVEVLNGRMIFTAFNTPALFTTEDPEKGVWTKLADLKGYPDPDIFVDDDQRVFLYFGCSYNGNICVVELDPAHQFQVIHGPLTCFTANYAAHGFEVAGEVNRGDATGGGPLGPWLEGAWMTKHAGTYYLQYSAPGTQYKSYADGVYTATNPLGPYTYAPYSPFSHKPTGFIGGAGHSSMVQAADQDYWHVSTMTISVRHMFERRLGLFPAAFTPDGQLYCNTLLGDYPQFVPGLHSHPADDNSPGWMLLSYHKPATASSVLAGFPVQNAFDEDIRTWWSAASGQPGEWLQVDLGQPSRIEALQVNFADQGITNLDRLEHDAYQYTVETSADGQTWQTSLDRRDRQQDSPHDYTQLAAAVTARYVRLVNVHTPDNGLFSISDLRLFGHAPGNPPDQVPDVVAARNPDDPRRVHLTWQPADNADFYIIRYGLAPDRLFNNYQVYQTNDFDINSLNLGTSYYFTVTAANGTGLSPAGPAQFLK